MREMDVMRSKEQELRREKELFVKEMRITQERMAEREEALNARLDEAHKIVDTMRAKYDADLELYLPLPFALSSNLTLFYRHKANYQKSLDEERQSVQRERAKLLGILVTYSFYVLVRCNTIY